MYESVSNAWCLQPIALSKIGVDWELHHFHLCIILKGILSFITPPATCFVTSKRKGCIKIVVGINPHGTIPASRRFAIPIAFAMLVEQTPAANPYLEELARVIASSIVSNCSDSDSDSDGGKEESGKVNIMLFTQKLGTLLYKL